MQPLRLVSFEHRHTNTTKPKYSSRHLLLPSLIQDSHKHSLASLQDGVSILGGAIGAMRIPEKWFPGLVDFYLNSHNIMHVLVVVAVYSMHKVNWSQGAYIILYSNY